MLFVFFCCIENQEKILEIISTTNVMIHDIKKYVNLFYIWNLITIEQDQLIEKRS